MPTVLDVIQSLLPRGSAPSRRRRRPSWRACPPWPPDVFAVAATLAVKSGCYAESAYAPVVGDVQYFSDERVDEIVKLGKRWRTRGRVPSEIEGHWHDLLGEHRRDVTDRHDLSERFKHAVMTLLAASDEASLGMGFPSAPQHVLPKLARVLESNYRIFLVGGRDAPLRHLPKSICWLVPPTQACVQPKTVTSQVGVTLRSFSHNLALLPSVGEVQTEWIPVATVGSKAPEQTPEHCTLLAVPYPYQVRGESFVDAAIKPLDRDQNAFRYFDVAQDWLSPGGRKLTGAQIATEFLVPLCEAARREVGSVHGVVFPEMSLAASLAVDVCEQLKIVPGMELFIAGVLRTREDSLVPENGAYVTIFRRSEKRGKTEIVAAPWIQGKHHRWCLDRSQIIRYHLGHALGGFPNARWWERIDVEDRSLSFHLFRPGASLAVLICEDLARIDPVQNVIRAVGPNLVIALLMDGPQLKGRWPARYATVLADDPGSGVLTLTSLGMVRRSTSPGDPPSRVVAMWKSAGGEAQELPLPDGAHALALTLSSRRVRQRTLDRRTDNETTEILELTAVRPIALPRDMVPQWVEQ